MHRRFTVAADPAGDMTGLWLLAAFLTPLILARIPAARRTPWLAVLAPLPALTLALANPTTRVVDLECGAGLGMAPFAVDEEPAVIGGNQIETSHRHRMTLSRAPPAQGVVSPTSLRLPLAKDAEQGLVGRERANRWRTIEVRR